MSYPYPRVIPRDLFNEASLIKCYGQLYILTEDVRGVAFIHDGSQFDIHQDASDGSIFINNITVTIMDEPLHLWRPLNSRSDMPLYITTKLGEYRVFRRDDQTGAIKLTDKFLEILEQLSS